MRTLYLVGMAPPIEKPVQLSVNSRDLSPHASGSLGKTLVPLDPRHGVFPNHVMTPLLATLYHLSDSRPNADAFLREQVPELLKDNTERRLNVLDMPVGKSLRISSHCREMLDCKFNPSTDLMLVFGYWSISSIVFYTLTGKTEFTEAEVDNKSEEFLRGVLRRLGTDNDLLPYGVPTKRAPRPGAYFRLLTCSDINTPRVVDAISATIVDLGVNHCDVAKLTKLYRSLVPLPHDEAYKNKPIGKFQNCFMLAMDPDRHSKTVSPPHVFWRYIGSVVARRLIVGDNPLN